MEEIEYFFTLQREAKNKVKSSSLKYRLDKLKKLKKVILSSLAEINEGIHLDFNKASIEVELTEVMPILSYLNYVQSNLKKWMAPQKKRAPLLFKGTESEVVFEAKGNSLVISPWNYPFQLSMYPVITSFIAGNTTILKPSEFTPAINKIIIKILSEVFTEEEVKVFEGEVDVSSALLNLPFNHIFFTGSTAVGKIVMKKASEHLASVSLELGGKSPVVLEKGCDLKLASKKIMWGKLVNSGQTCVAPDYILVHKEEEQDFIKEALFSLKEFYGSDFKSDYSKIITTKHTTRLKSLLEDALKKGAKAHGEDVKISEEERIFPPVLLTGLNQEMDIMKEEIFGPLLPIVSYENIDEAISFINSYPNALHLYVFSKNESVSDKIISETHSGGVTVNDVLLSAGHPELPFGGAGESGIGKYHGEYGFLEFSNQKSVMKRELDLGASYFYPPYTKAKKSIVQNMIKKFNRLL